MSLSTRMVRIGAREVIRIQVTTTLGSVVDISNYSAQYGVKKRMTDTSHQVGPITGSIIDSSNGKWQFVITGGSTLSLTPFRGKEGIAMFDQNNSMTPLTPPGGNECHLVWSVIDGD